MAEITATEVDTASLSSAGQRLRQAREAQNYTLEQASRHLHLDIQTLTSIESDHAPEHIPVTYLRGYLRAYAKWLDLSPEDIVAEFNRKHEDTSTLTGIQSLSALPASSSTQRTNWLMPLMLVAGVVGLGALGWFAGPPLWEQVSPMFASSESESATPEAVTPVAEGELALNLAPLESEGSEQAASDSGQSGSLSLDLPAAESTPTPGAATAEKAPATETVDVDSLPGTAESLQFNFTGDCWVRVTDANDEVLAIGTKQQGHRMRVSGPAPLTVVLGNPTGVEILHNGRPVDLSGFPTGRTATLTINALTRE